MEVGISGHTTNYATCGIYDPANGQWSTAPNLSDKKGSHTATLMPDGKILIAGGFQANASGYSGNSVSSCELYDISAPNSILHTNVIGIESECYPNPFNSITKINYQLQDANNYITLKVYDMWGREIETLEEGEKPSGYYNALFDGSNLPEGLYFYKLQANKSFEVKKILLVK